MDPDSNPSSPAAILRAQQRELARVAEILERLTSIATNKNVSVAEAVEEARAAAAQRLATLERAIADSERAAATAKAISASGAEAADKVAAAAEKIIKAAKLLREEIGVLQEKRRYYIYIVSAFICGLLVLPILSFVPGLNISLATLIMHNFATDDGIKAAGKIIYYSVK